MHITVIAMNEGFAGARRARRYFDNGQAVRLEVLNQEDDPEDVAPGVPDPERIGRKSYQALVADPRIKLLADGETVATHSRAAFEEAKRAAEGASREAFALKLEVARLGEQNAELRRHKADNEELRENLLDAQAEVYQLRTKLAEFETATASRPVEPSKLAEGETQPPASTAPATSPPPVNVAPTHGTGGPRRSSR